MIAGDARPLTRRVLIVDDKLNGAGTTSAGSRAVRTLAAELRGRGIDVIEALSLDDGRANVVSDAAIHGVFVNWTLGKNDERTHCEATELLRSIRARNAKVPVFLMADRSVAGTVTVEVATLDEAPTGGKLATESNGAVRFKAAPHRILTFWFHD